MGDPVTSESLTAAALHGLLQKVRDTGLPLVSVTRVDADPTGTPGTEPR